MTGGVYLWYYSNPSSFGIGYYTFEVGLAVDSIEATILAEFRNSWDMHWEAVLVYYVPM
jgi:hypothetical protein